MLRLNTLARSLAPILRHSRRVGTLALLGESGELRVGGLLPPTGGVTPGTWAPMSSAGAPLGRSGHAAVWTGQEMLVFGGETAGGAVATGGAFNPAIGKWRPLSTLGGPLARSEAVGAWTGSELLVFGGRANGGPVAVLQRLNPQPDWYSYRKP